MGKKGQEHDIRDVMKKKKGRKEETDKNLQSTFGNEVSDSLAVKKEQCTSSHAGQGEKKIENNCQVF